MLTGQQIDALIVKIVERCRPELIYLFGSYAKGTATSRSDLDILVVKNTELPSNMRIASLTPLVANRVVPVDLHMVTPEEFSEYGQDPHSFLGTVLRSGKLVYQRA